MQSNMTSTDCFTFGKYKGQNILTICYDDPKYCLWADENIDFFNLTEEQRRIAQERLKEKEDAYCEWAEETYGVGYSFD